MTNTTLHLLFVAVCAVILMINIAVIAINKKQNNTITIKLNIISAVICIVSIIINGYNALR